MQCQSAVIMCSRAFLPSSEYRDEEKIGVRSIRLVHQAMHFTGVVSSFVAANRILVHWMTLAKGRHFCEFEIFYNDGCTVSGTYGFSSKSRNRPALARFIKANAGTLCLGPRTDGSHPDNDQPTIPFLEHYELEEFAHAAGRASAS